MTNTPYFYIIQHKDTKKMYAGCRFAKACHPNEFMKPDGYLTSSNIINEIIQQEGVCVFDVLRIDTNCDGIGVAEYESLFLSTNNCAASSEWYNMHNADGRFPVYGTTEYTQIFMSKYGVAHPMLVPAIIAKRKQTCIDRYGVESAMQLVQVQEKAHHTNLQRYGYKHPVQVPQFNEKMKATNMERYGVEYPLMSPNVRQQIKNTNLSRYGKEHNWSVLSVREKIKNTNIIRYGVDHPLKSTTICEKIKNTNIERYGYNTPFASPAIQQQIKDTNLARYGYDNPMKSPVIQQKTKCTNLERYGYPSPFHSPEIHLKSKNTIMERYGVEHIMQVPEFCERNNTNGRITRGKLRARPIISEIKQLLIDYKIKISHVIKQHQNWMCATDVVLADYKTQILKYVESNEYRMFRESILATKYTKTTEYKRARTLVNEIEKLLELHKVTPNLLFGENSNSWRSWPDEKLQQIIDSVPEFLKSTEYLSYVDKHASKYDRPIITEISRMLAAGKWKCTEFGYNFHWRSHDTNTLIEFKNKIIVFPKPDDFDERYILFNNPLLLTVYLKSNQHSIGYKSNVDGFVPGWEYQTDEMLLQIINNIELKVKLRVENKRKNTKVNNKSLCSEIKLYAKQHNIQHGDVVNYKRGWHCNIDTTLVQLLVDMKEFIESKNIQNNIAEYLV
jgi:hypothetical protein